MKNSNLNGVAFLLGILLSLLIAWDPPDDMADGWDDDDEFTAAVGADLELQIDTLQTDMLTALAYIGYLDDGTFSAGDLACTNCVDDADLADADFGDFACNDGGGGCLVDANAIALGTDTTGGYAASATEGGSATTAVTATTATTATALAANGANASAGSAILGVDASGAAEGSFDVWTEAENTTQEDARPTVSAGTTKPPTCVVGSLDLESDVPEMCICTAANTWGQCWATAP